MGKAWRTNTLTAADWRLLRVLWNVLRDNQHQEVCGGGSRRTTERNGHRGSHRRQEGVKWHIVALTLLSIADEAAKGMGFALPEDKPLAKMVLDDYGRMIRRSATTLNIPMSLTYLVSPHDACVLPKARTTQSGHSIRSLSHHLALLPPVGEVTSSWFPGNMQNPDTGNLGLLLVPFPYQVSSNAFEPLPTTNGAYFGLRQSWAEGADEAPRIHSVLRKLLATASAKGMTIHGVVMPEAALPWRVAERLALLLRENGIEFFISGVLQGGRTDGARNAAFLASYENGEIPYRIYQFKHHRWKLTDPQIRAYRLERRLDPGKDWWEQIDISDRTCSFHVFRHGACLTTLICEDLARVDPVQRILRAVGPNLVIALLMDDAQLDWRWSARYAGVLAEDPGAGVLALTSAGMVRRSRYAPKNGGWHVALWREPGMRKPRHLILRRGDQALAMQLRLKDVTEITVDGRSDQGAAVAVHYVRVRSI